MPTNSEPSILYTILTAIIAAIGGVITGSFWVNKAQAKKLNTDTDIARREFDKQERAEYLENEIRYKKAFKDLNKEVEIMQANFISEVTILKAKILKLQEELNLTTRKYNLERILNSSTRN